MQGKENALHNGHKTRRSITGHEVKGKIRQLQVYVCKAPYIDLLEQRSICKSFGLQYIKSIFQKEYRQRFFDYLKENTTTVATVTKETGIPQKYLTEVKFHFEKKGLLQVLAIGICPSTGSNGVQFVSTNPKIWDNFKLPSNQLDLFEGNSKMPAR